MRDARGELEVARTALLETQRTRERASAGAVHVGFEDAEFFNQRVELGRVVADDGGGAHGLVVGS